MHALSCRILSLCFAPLGESIRAIEWRDRDAKTVGCRYDQFNFHGAAKRHFTKLNGFKSIQIFHRMSELHCQKKSLVYTVYIEYTIKKYRVPSYQLNASFEQELTNWILCTSLQKATCSWFVFYIYFSQTAAKRISPHTYSTSHRDLLHSPKRSEIVCGEFKI